MFFAWVYAQYHANWVDPVTVIVAMLYAVLQRFRGSAAKRVLSRDTGLDVLNGLAIFPLVLVIASTFSPYLTAELLASNKAILSGAGALALFSILED